MSASSILRRSTTRLGTGSKTPSTGPRPMKNSGTPSQDMGGRGRWGREYGAKAMLSRWGIALLKDAVEKANYPRLGLIACSSHWKSRSARRVFANELPELHCVKRGHWGKSNCWKVVTEDFAAQEIIQSFKMSWEAQRLSDEAYQRSCRDTGPYDEHAPWQRRMDAAERMLQASGDMTIAVEARGSERGRCN